MLKLVQWVLFGHEHNAASEKNTYADEEVDENSEWTVAVGVSLLDENVLGKLIAVEELEEDRCWLGDAFDKQAFEEDGQLAPGGKVGGCGRGS